MRLHEVLDDPQVDKLYIIMEFVKNGALTCVLAKYKGQIDLMTVWRYFRDILSGLHYRKYHLKKRE